MAALPPWFDEDRWVPPPPAARDPYVIEQFLSSADLPDYRSLLRRSVDEPEWFYRHAFAALDLPWRQPFTAVRAGTADPAWPQWFPGATTNVAWMAVSRWVEAGHGDRDALVAGDEAGARRALTYAELEAAVDAAGAGLEALGVGPGDVVALYLPFVPEAAVALLACARIGAVAAPAYSGYGEDALGERLRRSGARVLVTAEAVVRRGRVHPALPVARAAAEGTAVARIVVVGGSGTGRPAAGPGTIPWEALLAAGAHGCATRFVPADTPCLLVYTSGSTGPPKGTVHTHGGYPYRIGIELALSFDVRPGDRFAWVTDMGWIMGPVGVVGPLSRGATAVLLDGAPDHPPDRLWQVVEQEGLTHLGLSPTLVRRLAALGPDGPPAGGLRTLRVLGTTGEPCTPPVWRWLHRHVGGGRRPIINWTGGTEVGCGLLAGSPVVETAAGRFAGPAPGIDAAVFDERGQAVRGRTGELVVRTGWPSMTRGFWREPGRYEEGYWSRWPGVWAHGDLAIEHPDGTWELVGRSDDTMNVAGKRVGPTEYETVAQAVAEVTEAVAVGLPDPDRNQAPVVLVTTRPGCDREAVADAVAEVIARALGAPLRAAAVVAVGALPHTRSNKLHRRAVRAWLTGDDAGDLTTLVDPESRAAVVAARPVLQPLLDRAKEPT